MKMSPNAAMLLLQKSAGVPPAETMQGRTMQVNRSKHRRLASTVCETMTTRMDLSEKWAAGTPSRREIERVIGKEIRARFGTLTWIIWAWRIYSWISIIYDAWTDEGMRK